MGIFYNTITGMESLILFLAEYSRYIVLVHAAAAAVGLGAATVTDVFFFRFLKDFRISESEAEILSTISRIIWAALATIVVSGVALYIPQADDLNHSPRFLVKMIAVAVLIINGILLNILIAPQLEKISFRSSAGEISSTTEGLLYIRKLAFALGAISAASWYSAFILGSFRSLEAGFSALLAAYGTVLGIAVIGSQIMERWFSKKSREQRG